VPAPPRGAARRAGVVTEPRERLGVAWTLRERREVKLLGPREVAGLLCDRSPMQDLRSGPREIGGGLFPVLALLAVLARGRHATIGRRGRGRRLGVGGRRRVR